MKFFCLVFGHTWVPTTEGTTSRWNTTKDGLTLVPTSSGDVRFLDRCQRCGETRDVQLRGGYQDEGPAPVEEDDDAVGEEDEAAASAG